MKIYRFTSNGEGVFSAGKRLLPENLVEEVLENKKWLIKPNLPEGEYRFYLTEKGKGMYEKSLMISHKKYLEKIKLESYESDTLKEITYKDEYQIVEKLK